MAIDRFHLPDPEATELAGAEAHHCLHVMRHGPGDRIAIFDGRGNEIMAEITSATKDRVAFKALSRQHTPKPGYGLTLVQAMPKGRPMELIIQKATELGVSRIIPLMSERVVVHLDDERVESRLEKWRGIVIEAAKQCGQNWLPAIEPVRAAKEFFDAPPTAEIAAIGSLQGGTVSFRALVSEFEAAHGRRPASAVMVVGPEGDFTPAELNAARRAGYRPVTLGPIVLRSDTAAIFSLSVLAYELQNL
ncbi:MAG: 16S rRNA (uracil(1498)-N(3))-methyltransferase [Verrucomicrobiae bacterium]|nr:16S rRNA (uracil(1498)-N(3))-methyltransferase [Verrucomicrobiae bacterium]